MAQPPVSSCCNGPTSRWKPFALGCASGAAARLVRQLPGRRGALAADGADLVLIDAWIEDGLPLLTQLKSGAATRYLPIVIATAEEPAAVAAHALALGADDVFAMPMEDAELEARTRALARLAKMEVERRRRDLLLAHFGVAPAATPGLPAIERISVLLIGPAGGDQIQVLTALGGAATAAYAETSDSAIERLRRDNLDVALVTTGHDQHELQRLCATVRSDAELFDLPVLLVARRQHFAEPTQPFAWGVSDVLFQPFHPEVLRLRGPGLGASAAAAAASARRPRQPGADQRSPHAAIQPRLSARLRRPSDRESARAGGMLALVGLTVARMGQINELYGYAAGDRVLATLGGVLASSSRAEDLPARLEGDRFCLVLNNATALDARAAAERFGILLSHTPIALPGGQYIQIALEAGVAELAEGDDAPRLIGRAFAHKQLFTLSCAS